MVAERTVITVSRPFHHLSGCKTLSNETLRDVHNVFANAPIQNPDNETDVDVHFDVDRSPSDIPVVMTSKEFWGQDGVGRTTFDHKEEGIITSRSPRKSQH